LKHYCPKNKPSRFCSRFWFIRLSECDSIRKHIDRVSGELNSNNCTKENQRMNFLKRFFLTIILNGLLMGLFTETGQALDPKMIDQKRKWAAYTFKNKDGRVCYIASAPTKERGKYKQRGQPYALVTNRPSLNVKGEVNFIAGYSFKKKSKVKVTIGKKIFNLVTSGNGAWTSDSSTDAQLVKAMIRGNRMVVVGFSSRGTKTTDTYSLAGFTAMKKRIDKECKK